MKITIDQRACGAGKTTDGIYPLIRKHIKLDQPTVIVAGSINLQKAYKEEFPSIFLINSAITDESTVSRAYAAMNDKHQLICITHQCYVMMDYHSFRNDYALIIDEAITGIYKETTVKIDSDQFVKFNWSEHFEIDCTKHQIDYNDLKEHGLQSEVRNEFYPLQLFGSSTDNMISQSNTYKTITDQNYDHFITPFDYNIMMGESTKNKIFTIYSLLNIKVFSGWKSIHIAAAAFEMTAMYHLMNRLGLQVTTTHKFKPHVGNITVHSTSMKLFSNTKRKERPEILTEYHDEVNKRTNGEMILAIRNVSEKSSLDDEILLTHNVHGLNDAKYMACTHISLESALIPSKALTSFISKVLLSSSNFTSKNDLLEAIINMHSTYLFYQIIMRCKLRTRDYNNEEINIYVMDIITVSNLLHYFDVTASNPIELSIDAELKTASNKKQSVVKKQPLTPAEKQKAYRERKKERKKEQNKELKSVTKNDNSCISLIHKNAKKVTLFDSEMIPDDSIIIPDPRQQKTERSGVTDSASNAFCLPDHLVEKIRKHMVAV
jgi:hypothetical protein